MILWGVYEPDGTLNSLWVTQDSAVEFVASRPGWTWGELWYPGDKPDDPLHD